MCLVNRAGRAADKPNQEADNNDGDGEFHRVKSARPAPERLAAVRTFVPLPTHQVSTGRTVGGFHGSNFLSFRSKAATASLMVCTSASTSSIKYSAGDSRR